MGLAGGSGGKALNSKEFANAGKVYEKNCFRNVDQSTDGVGF